MKRSNRKGSGSFTFGYIVRFFCAYLLIISAFSDSSSRKPLALNQYTGVAYLEPAQCTGSLLTGGRYIITAAHCLNQGGVKVPAQIAIKATFKLPSGEVSIHVSNYYIHHGWTGYESEVGNDIAILKLKKTAPVKYRTVGNK